MKDEDTISEGEGKEPSKVGEGIFDSLTGYSSLGYREQVNGFRGGRYNSCESSKGGLALQRGMQEPGTSESVGSVRPSKCKCRTVGTNSIHKEESQEASSSSGRPLLPGDDWEEG